jgi:hypothetical protein
MTQANVIVLSIREDQAEEFERLFEQEELPIWREYAEAGKFLTARLARVEFGSEKKEGVRHYTLFVEVPGMAEHSAHDDDPRFGAFLERARQLQPDSPLVFGGDTIFAVDASQR